MRPAFDLQAETDAVVGTTDLAAIRDRHSPGQKLRIGCELFNRRALETMRAFLADDLVHDMRGTGLPDMELFHGPGGYMTFVDSWLEAFPRARLEVVSTEERGSAAFGVVRQTVSGASSGAPVDFTYGAVSVYEGGMLARSWIFLDVDRARALFDELAE